MEEELTRQKLKTATLPSSQSTPILLQEATPSSACFKCLKLAKKFNKYAKKLLKKTLTLEDLRSHAN